MRLKPSITIPLALVLIVVGVLGHIASVVHLAVTYGHFINKGPRVTLPAADIPLQLTPGTEHAVFQEITGAHITVNQPLVELTEDSPIDLRATDTGEPIRFERADWTMFISFFGLDDRRRALAVFTPPDSGAVTLSIPDAAPGQVVYVGMTHNVFAEEVLPRYRIPVLASLISVLVGVGLILAHLVNRSRVSLERPVTGEA